MLCLYFEDRKKSLMLLCVFDMCVCLFLLQETNKSTSAVCVTDLQVVSRCVCVGGVGSLYHLSLLFSLFIPWCSSAIKIGVE